MQKEVELQPNLAVIAAVQLSNVSDEEFQASLYELRELAKTLRYEVVNTFVQKRTSFDKGAYLGTGKIQEIRSFIQKNTEPDELNPIPSNKVDLDIKTLLVDHDISPSQARNLEIEIGCSVMDRTMVILEIFHRNARSPAARAQVEIARLGYMAPRLREAAKLAGPQGRQRSGEGGRGAGESQTELDRRKVRDRIAELQQDIIAMDAERRTQSARRQERQGLASVALVGYTNAGKSTLMRALTGSEVLVANKLFATLDTTVRALHPESLPRILISDTVGFIKNLPHGLVASFKSTLQEALDASLLLHVIDASDPGFERQIEVTNKVLEEIGANDIPRFRIFNKIDSIGDETLQAERKTFLQYTYPNCFVISARKQDDVGNLHKKIVAFFQKDLVEHEFFLPWLSQQLRGEIYANCKVIEERTEDEGVVFKILAAPDTIKRIRSKILQ